MSFLNKVTVEDLDVKGRRVLVRVDFNVPLKDGKVTNDNRIVGAIPTIRYLADHGAKVILCSHLGKPKGPDAAFTMAPVAARLGELMGRPVLFADDDTVVGENARRMVSEMKDGDILVLQNTRFRKEETKNEPEFSEETATPDEIVANDILKQSFGTDDTYDPMAAAEEPASDSDDLDDDTSENGFVINVHAIKHHITPDEIETTDTDEDMETPANVDAFLNDDDDDEDDNDSHTHHSRFRGFFKK